MEQGKRGNSYTPEFKAQAVERMRAGGPGNRDVLVGTGCVPGTGNRDVLVCPRSNLLRIIRTGAD